MPIKSPFPAYVVRKSAAGEVSASIEMLTLDDLPQAEILIEVACSSLNYKDALACQGHPGVVRQLPHVPGIDCAGLVVQSTVSDFQSGDPVLVTGYDLGAGHWGGFAQYVRVPAEWVVRLPDGLSIREAMIYGTAGFTAAQAISAIVDRGITREKGEVLVTGATGGVGSLATVILSALGYKVVAVTGKRDRHEWLRQLGAHEILDRPAVVDSSDRPLLPARWAAAIDTVGGDTLATILRSTHHRAVIAACGLVGGDQLPLTVYPFILRGVTLAGIDSAKCPRPERLQIWQKLAGPWRVTALEQLAETITLRELPNRVAAILAGQLVGRTVVEPRAE
jgi:putative YhdH/YhfP family quinone oxidoreductase